MAVVKLLLGATGTWLRLEREADNSVFFQMTKWKDRTAALLHEELQRKESEPGREDDP
jgi:hypothetical protein